MILATGSAGHLIGDFGIVIVAAAIAAIVFYKLKLPVILGFVLSGMLIGPYWIGKDFIHDAQGVMQLAELGVIFLLFSIGLEFDLKKLKAVLGGALGALILQTIAMIFIGMQFGRLMGFTPVSSIFLAALLTISSSMVTIRVMRDQGRMKLPHAQLAVGILILEDILAIIVLVLLGGVAVTGELDVGKSLQVSFLIFVFVAFTFWVGKMVAPKVVDVLHQLGSFELITLFALGMILGIGVIAESAQFSLALGAFLAGAILSQSKLAHDIEESTQPLRDVFGAVFFVSVGMQIDPFQLLEKWHFILLLSLLVVVGKLFSCYLGLYLSGQPPRSCFRASMAKSQIGEFSFVILNLGVSLGVMDDAVTAVAAGVALVTILATPIISGPSEAIYYKFAAITPQPIIMLGNFYHQLLSRVNATMSSSVFLKLVSRPIGQCVFWFFLFNAILLLAVSLAGLVEMKIEDPTTEQFALAGIWLAAAAAVAPFIVALLKNTNAIIMIATEAAFTMGSDGNKMVSSRIYTLLANMITGVVVFVLSGIYLTATAQFFPWGAAMATFLLIATVIGIIFWRQLNQLNSRMELLFMEGLKESTQELAKQCRERTIQEISEKHPWPIEMEEFTVRPGIGLCGQRIIETEIRKLTGCNIIAVGRGGYSVFDPSPEAHILPGDVLTLIGTPEQIVKARQVLSVTPSRAPWQIAPQGYALERVFVAGDSELAGNTLAGANVRRRFGINIVGIQRGEEQITKPEADFMLRAGDILIAVGNPASLERFKPCCEQAQVA